MKMNLLEWKQYQTQTFREELKRQMHSGVSHDHHFLFSDEQLEEMKQEVEIERFEETVTFDGEIDLDPQLIENHSEVQEVFDFVPNEEGQVMDLVFEFDLNEVDPSINSMNALRELLFAEDYEMEMIEEESLDEGEDLDGEDKNCGCGQTPCKTYGMKDALSDDDLNRCNENVINEEKNPAGGKKAKGKPARAKVIFKRAKGQVSKKKICGPGMRLAGNRCLPQTGTQKAKMRRAGIKLKRAKRAMGGGAKKKAALKAKITKRRVKGRSRSLANTTN